MSSPLDRLALLRPGILTKRISSFDRSGGNGDNIQIAAGENRAIAEIAGAGIIKHIWITIACDDPLIRRNAIVRMFWDGEGDDMFLIDGEPWPGSLHGTGTEDYLNTSWSPNEIYLHPYFGAARVNKEIGWLGRTHCYRFHLEDPVFFQKSLRVSIEHGHANVLTLDLATVAYWYQAEPHAPFPTILPKEKRQPMPPIGAVEIHKWRDSWRREQGGGPLWGNEPLPGSTKLE